MEPVLSRLKKRVGENPNLVTNGGVALVVGLVLTSVPIIGWFVGPWILILGTMYFAYRGHCQDNKNGNVGSFLNSLFRVVFFFVEC